MNLTKIRIEPFSLMICVTILGAWVISAFYHDLSIFETQKSRLLITFGAANGESLLAGDYWKLITSQFVHVRFPHMLFNVAVIYCIGAALEEKYGPSIFLLAYFLSGTVGQYASVTSYPLLVTSGASQALCGIVGSFLVLTLFTEHKKKFALYLALVFVLVQIFLDVYFSGKIKAGHYMGFLSGVLFGLIYGVRTRFFLSESRIIKD